MARFLRLRLRPGTGLFSYGAPAMHEFHGGDEVVVRFDDAAELLSEKGRRAFEVIDDFEDESGRVQPDFEIPDEPD